MELEQFRSDFLNEVAAEASATGEFKHNVFTARVADALEDTGQLSEFQPAFYFSRTPITRMDGIGIDEEETRLDLLVTWFDGSPTGLPSLTQTELDRALASLRRFLGIACGPNPERVLEETDEHYDAALKIRDMAGRRSRLRFVVLTDMKLSDRVRELAPIELSSLGTAEVVVWDIQRLARILGPEGNEPIRIDLRDYTEDGLACLPAHVDGEDYEAYLAVVPGRVLSEIYARYGARLLEQNVRSFLQARGKVNKGIRTTIQNQPQMFFAYNNGITATAEGVEIEYDDGGFFLRRIDNLQIVNGGQTTASIFTTNWRDKASLDRIFVQMKLAVVPHAALEKIVPNISRFANTQNKVSEADLFSNHPYHIRMEEFSRRVWAPAPPGSPVQTKWFYERARGQYADMRSQATGTARSRFDRDYPKHQVFTKTDLAKFENVWLPAPHVVSLGAQKNFANFAEKTIVPAWAADPDEFNEDYFKRCAVHAMVFREAENVVSRARWYAKGYRANIVAYAISLIAEEITRSGMVLDALKIWESQSITDGFRKVLDEAGHAAQSVLLEPPAGIRNVSEWAKKPACWELLKKQSVDTSPMNSLLIGKDDARTKGKEAKKQQRMDSEIDAEVWCHQLDPEKVRELAEFATDNDLMTPRTRRIFDKLQRSGLLNAREAAVVLEIANQARELGLDI